MTEPDRDRWLERVRASYRTPSSVAPDARDAKERLMAAVRRALPPRGVWWRRPWGRAALSLAATLAALLGVALTRPWTRTPPTGVAGGGEQVVHFMLVAPAASGVAVVGDFNGWDSQATPMRRSGDGPTDPWTASIVVLPGRRILTYAFLVDGERWVTDPAAPLAPAPTLGSPTSVLVLREKKVT